jgi:hypothetical protein
LRKSLMEQSLPFLMQPSQSLCSRVFVALHASAGRAMLPRRAIRICSRVVWPPANTTTCCNPSSTADRPINSGWSRACRS